VSSKKVFEKTAVIGIDLEDWYHLDYIKNKNYDLSMLDGFYKILEILNKKKILASIFVVGELVKSLAKDLNFLAKNKFEIASHGFTHKRPLEMTVDEFISELNNTKKILEEVTGHKVIGFRAPCFSLNRKLLDVLFDQGYLYDSSKINFRHHNLYGNLDINDFTKINEYTHIILKNNKKKAEFEIPTYKILGQNIPFSGGGYLRFLPEFLIEKIIIEKEKEKVPIFFYIHPFEFSNKKIKRSEIGIKNYLRMNVGRKEMHKKFLNIINFMISRNWKFTTFKNLYEEL